MIFLIHYDPLNGGRLLEILQFTSAQSDVAAHARLQMEVAALGSGHRSEIVTLEAESLEELSKTHSRYFRSITEMATLASEKDHGKPDIDRKKSPPKRR